MSTTEKPSTATDPAGENAEVVTHALTRLVEVPSRRRAGRSRSGSP